MAKPIALDTGVVAFASLVKILDCDEVSDAMEAGNVDRIAQHLLSYADPEYKPTARKLVLTLDLSGPVAGQQPDFDKPYVAGESPGGMLRD